MSTLFDDMDDMFKQLNAFINETTPYVNKGLKAVLHRPHNLYTIKNEAGEVTAYKIKVVTTPFKKDDVSVKVNGDILTILCGSENHVDEDEEHLVYHGISAQSWVGKLKLKGIDIKSIAASVKDGMLEITLPTMKKEKLDDTIDIAIS